MSRHDFDEADDSLEARLAAARAEIVLARLRGAEAVEAPRRAADEFRAEFSAVSNSRARQWLLRGRRSVLAPVQAITHPVRMWQSLADRAVAASPLPALADNWHQVRHEATLLGLEPFADRQTNRLDIDDAIRWLGIVDLAGVK